MKRLIALALITVLVAACGGDTAVEVTDPVNLAAPGADSQAATTTTVPALTRYEVYLEVEYHAYTRIVGHGGIPTEYRLTYTTRDELLSGDATNAAEGIPDDAEVVWNRNCYSAIMGPDIELLGAADGTVGLDIPDSLELVPFEFADRYPDVDWLAPPATSLSSLSGALAVVHRLPSTLSLGEEANCGEPGPRVVILNAGHAWMNAETTGMADALMSPAAALNLTMGSRDPQYVIEGDGDASGWLLQLFDPQVIGATPLFFENMFADSDELGGWEFSVEGEIRVIED